MLYTFNDSFHIYKIELTKDLNIEKIFKEIQTLFPSFNHCQFQQPEINEVTLQPINNIRIFSCFFSSILSIQQEQELQNLIDIHDSFIAVFKITNENSTIEQIENLDYDIMGFHKKRYIVKGLLKIVEYYKNYNPLTQEYSDLVVRESRTYLNDVNTGLSYCRLLNVDWYLTDGAVGHSIINRSKFYSFIESRSNLQARRTNIINEAEEFLLFSLMREYGEQGFIYAQTFLTQAKLAKDLYVDGVWLPLESSIINATETWMTQVRKDTLLNIIRYTVVAQE